MIKLLPLLLLLLTFTMSSCRSTFVVKTKTGTEAAYVGSFATKSSFEKHHITLPSGATIDDEIVNNDETEAISKLAALSLAKAGINAGVSTTNNAVNAIK